ncbi:MAG TPA: serine/threonine-protein kinase, partial [Kofleriaceae bacterium]|nr:serine/threonine-protein kinase [Kofleriaceae bacterium]
MSDHTGHDSVIGEVLASRYRVEALIGEGAMGAVYRARHVKVGRAFAIKVLHPRFSEEERTRKRFAREAEVAGKLHHPNVVSVVDVGDLADGRRYLVMEYAEGVTLLDLINETSPMAASRVISLVRQLCSGLQHAHELGLIHRDFKPDNVIVERDRHGNETPRIVDFGTAILREEAESTSGPRLTTRGLVLGTPHYMSPEHATGSPIDHRIDLFALGVTCYEMMTGHSPYEGDGVDVARANLLLDTPVMSVRVPGLVVDPLLEAFTRKLMMKARDDRPASAAAARDLIDLIDRDRPAAAAALGVALDEPRPAPVVPPSVVTQPIPFEIEPATPAAAATDLAIPWIGGAPAGDTSGPAIPWPVAPSAPGWQPAVRAPSSPPASDAFDAPPTRMRAQPEATEQIVQMAPRTRVWRFVIPAFAALAVLLVMGIALRGRRTHAKTKRVDFASLNTGTAGGEAAPIAMAAVPTAPAAAAAAPAAAPAPSTAPVLDTAPAPSAAPSQAAPSQAAPSQAAPSQASPSQAAPSQAAPSQAAPSQAAPSQAAPSQAAPSQAAPSQAAPS